MPSPADSSKRTAGTDRLRPFRWRKGQSGNPSGRRNRYTEALRRELPPDEFAQIVAKAARAGDSRVIVALLERYAPRPEVALKLQASGVAAVAPITFTDLARLAREEDPRETLGRKLDTLAASLGNRIQDPPDLSQLTDDELAREARGGAESFTDLAKAAARE